MSETRKEVDLKLILMFTTKMVSLRSCGSHGKGRQ